MYRSADGLGYADDGEEYASEEDDFDEEAGDEAADTAEAAAPAAAKSGRGRPAAKFTSRKVDQVSAFKISAAVDDLGAEAKATSKAVSSSKKPGASMMRCFARAPKTLTPTSALQPGLFD